MKCTECGGLGEIPEPIVGTQIKTARGKLERGWRRTWLIGKLARSEGTNRALGEALGVVPSAIQAFKDRHADDIAAERERLAEQITGLWIADKLSRLAEHQQDVEDINEIIEGKLDAATPTPWNPLEPEKDGSATPSAVDDLPAWLRVKTGILRAAAEELGQLPQRVNVQVGGSLVTYRIEGVDLEQV